VTIDCEGPAPPRPVVALFMCFKSKSGAVCAIPQSRGRNVLFDSDFRLKDRHRRPPGGHRGVSLRRQPRV